VWTHRTGEAPEPAPAPAVIAPAIPEPKPAVVARAPEPDEVRRIETVTPPPSAPLPKPRPAKPEPVRTEPVKTPPVKTETAKPEPPPAPAPQPAVVEAPAVPPPPAPTPAVVRERTEPRLLRKVDPVYTEAARRAGLQGKVAYRLTVNAAGVPERLELVRGLEASLDRQAANAIAQWRFAPATEDGKAVPWVGIVEVEFRLINGPGGRPSLRPQE
jgi:periplasmic protein TonB